MPWALLQDLKRQPDNTEEDELWLDAIASEDNPKDGGFVRLEKCEVQVDYPDGASLLLKPHRQYCQGMGHPDARTHWPQDCLVLNTTPSVLVVGEELRGEHAAEGQWQLRMLAVLDVVRPVFAGSDEAEMGDEAPQLGEICVQPVAAAELGMGTAGSAAVPLPPAATVDARSQSIRLAADAPSSAAHGAQQPSTESDEYRALAQPQTCVFAYHMYGAHKFDVSGVVSELQRLFVTGVGDPQDEHHAPDHTQLTERKLTQALGASADEPVLGLVVTKRPTVGRFWIALAAAEGPGRVEFEVGDLVDGFDTKWLAEGLGQVPEASFLGTSRCVGYICRAVPVWTVCPAAPLPRCPTLLGGWPSD